MSYLRRLVCASVILSVAPLFAMAEDKPAAPAPVDEVIIKMDPYVVSGERMLPAPESWRHVVVPALEFTRGSKTVTAPGYYVLSNLSEKNTKVFVEELQLYQLAGAMLWPMIVQSLPREPIMVVIDDTKQAMSAIGDDLRLSWEGEPIAAAGHSMQDAFYDSASFATGVQLVEGDPVVPEEFLATPELPTDSNTATTRINVSGTTAKPEPRVMQKTWRRPLPPGYSYVHARNGTVTAQIHANGPRAGSANPDEEILAADLSRRLAEYVMFSFTEQPPRWFQTGLGWLIATTSVSRTRITFADTGGMLDRIGKMPSLEALLNKTGALKFEDEALAAAFTHWGLYGKDHKNAEKFMTLIQRQSRGPVTAKEFEEIMGLSYRKAEMAISNHTRIFADYTSHEFSGNIPELPEFVVSEATQAQVARLKAETYVAESKPDLALSELRVAYWRGEREPAMLTLLADLEERQGSVERAKKIVEGLQSLTAPPALIHFVNARLKFREIRKGKAPDEKLTAKETRTIMAPLGSAIQAGLTKEPVCAFFAEVVSRSGGRPHESVVAFLEQASKRFPNNSHIKKTLATAKAAPAGPAPTPAPQTPAP